MIGARNVSCPVFEYSTTFPKKYSSPISTSLSPALVLTLIVSLTAVSSVCGLLSYLDKSAL